ncbi:ABC transporter ATP-binding protein/permease [Mesorhizobium sp. LHD-90]|uniref:ABC transporter ATP-binding protein/permease n=1 Tax=Mesorhizobium sp. LHD-90 TaxID=3071414 RepID=UPI0027DF504D|nr:ABC transporter ATP-binding protein/permease [Mesorhizobium sp. LHD-90]MDQ6438127.1 ABC transporter ATP-binding protein/permease [Mesorhizobium sp. LHD-90]
MNDRTNRQTTIAVGDDSFRDQLRMMSGAFKASPVRNAILWLMLGIFAVIVATALGQVMLNRWNRPFYDAIERRDLPAFFHQLIVFAEIAGVLLVFNITQTWLYQMLRIKLREGLVRDLIGEWMRPRRAFRLAKAGAIAVNPDQRLHEDARHLAELSTDLGVGLLQASILLVSFVGVLWSLSSGFVFHISGREIEIPGYMVWAAILYAGTGSCLSWLAGRPLINLNSERYAREAELRFSLMRVNEHVDAISLAGGEGEEKRRLELDLATVLEATRRIALATVRLTWVTAGYGWITVVAPIVIASPVYFAGDLTFGGLMMAAAAFTQVHASLRWFIDNIGGIADWRATLLRVTSFRSALLKIDELHGVEKRIGFADAPEGRMTFDEVEVSSPEGCTRLSEPHVEIRQGERVLITGSPGAGKTLFFRALAGLWPWGSGRIGLPPGEAAVFIPRTPYFSPGTLRDALGASDAGGVFSDAELRSALESTGLGRLSERLDVDARWERELRDEELRLLAFARLVLHRPRWAVIDEAFDTLDAETRGRIFALLEEKLPDAAIVAIGRADPGEKFFTRTLHLSADPTGKALKRVRIAEGSKGSGAEREKSAELSDAE